MPNKVYVNPEGAITWRHSGGGGTHQITLASLAANSGRQGESHDFAGARSRFFEWRFKFKSATAPVVGEVVKIFAKTGDGVVFDNDDAEGDAALSAEDKLRNLTQIGVVVVDEAATGVEFSASGIIELVGDHFAPVIFNDTADAFSSTAADMAFDLIPVPDEIQ